MRILSIPNPLPYQPDGDAKGICHGLRGILPVEVRSPGREAPRIEHEIVHLHGSPGDGRFARQLRCVVGKADFLQHVQIPMVANVRWWIHKTRKDHASAFRRAVACAATLRALRQNYRSQHSVSCRTHRYAAGIKPGFSGSVVPHAQVTAAKSITSITNRNAVAAHSAVNCSRRLKVGKEHYRAMSFRSTRRRADTVSAVSSRRYPVNDPGNIPPNQVRLSSEGRMGPTVAISRPARSSRTSR